MAVAVDAVVRGHDAQAPEGEAGRQGHVVVAVKRRRGVGRGRGRELDAGDLEEPEVRRALGAVAAHDELDLRQDEAVARAVLAHHVVQVRQAPQVLDPLDVALDAHARVEAVEGFHQSDHARRGLAAEDGRRGRGLAGDVGYEDVVVG